MIKILIQTITMMIMIKIRIQYIQIMSNIKHTLKILLCGQTQFQMILLSFVFAKNRKILETLKIQIEILIVMEKSLQEN